MWKSNALWFDKKSPVTTQTIEVEKVVVKYVDVNYVDIDEKRFIRALHRLWNDDGREMGYSSPREVLEWVTQKMKDGVIAMLVEECVFIPREYTSMEASLREHRKPKS